ncbi:ArsR/SmtB family transcription factor [Nocardia macrotermitis]|uniref:ArsR/SmtB family transcription factor n=1 Tax=Nocardia macrotermitis TaxID=2585198 RepID=UPI0029E7EF8C|nr:metalloregulator ArsR/SmtB family transcription factor [Nocardia macrotermitis]
MQSEPDIDAVFKALADGTRRLLLDRLREHNGQTLRELCERVDMARQSLTQHLDILERAGLVTVLRRGRERVHYINPTPIHDIEQRWISVFDRPRLDVLRAIKNQAEEYAMTTTVPSYVYVTYIHASAEHVWKALTDADLTAQYWFHENVSDWEPGSPWEHRRADGSGTIDVVGKVLESEPPTKLVLTFEDSPEEDRSPSVVTFLVESHRDIVRLTVTHENLPNEEMLQGISRGWPSVIANLKSLLETGKVLPQAPWEMDSAAHA